MSSPLTPSCVTSAPMFRPFSCSCTPTTARSSLAVATIVTASVVLPERPGENNDTIGGATSGSGSGWAACHCATALFQYCRPAAPVMIVKHGCPLNVVGSVSGYEPEPSHTITLLRQSASLPGGGAIHICAPFPSREGPSVRNTLLYSARLGPMVLHFQNALWFGTAPPYTASIDCNRNSELLMVTMLLLPFGLPEYSWALT